MYAYQINILVDKRVQTEWLEWMKYEHIPDLLSTQCFMDYQLLKSCGDDNDLEEYCILYFFKEQGHFNKYEKEFADKFRADHKQRFGEFTKASRKIYELVF